MEWVPIDQLDISEREMFVVIAIDVKPTHSGLLKYTTDPYCVWFDEYDEEFVRWPHSFKPTHFMRLPSTK